MTEHQTPRGGDEFITLAGVLNVLWRRRWLIMIIVIVAGLGGIAYSLTRTPKHLAIATVRPGITSFNANGRPQRDWRIKDIIRWYRQGMYMQGVRDSLSLDPERPLPLIQAEYIPRDVGREGGNVITLSVPSADPDFTRAYLSAAIDVFNSFAEINSVGNSLSLSRDALDDEIEQLDNDRENVDIKRKQTDLEIDNARQELARFEADLERLKVAEQAAEVRLEKAEAEKAILERDSEEISEGLQGMFEVLETLEERDAALTARDSLRGVLDEPTADQFLWSELGQDKTGLTGSLLLGVLARQASIWTDRYDAVQTGFQGRLDVLQRKQEILREKADLEMQIGLNRNKIREMELTRDRSLEQEIVDIEDQKRILQSRLDVLISLEEIGVTVISDDPVYPKKRRMTVMATLAGIFCALVLAFVWEYLSRNRREIFADER